MSTFELFIIFCLVSLASHRIGKWFTAIRLPYITGYLAVGAIAGGFVLDVLPKGVDADLRFVDEVALGLIAFVAGSELFLAELRERIRTIIAMAGGMTIVGLLVIGGAVAGLAGVASFGDGLSRSEVMAMAVLGGTVLLALSPPSTIAVIKEVGARGRFTSTVLSITVVMDVVVVITFAASASVAGALLGDSGLSLSFVPILLIDLACAAIVGVVLGKSFARVLSWKLPWTINAAIILSAGYGVYEAADLIKNWSTDRLGFEVYIEPLLATLIAGAVVANFTAQRASFENVLHKVSPAVYVAFFTLTGLSLKLDTLLGVLPIAALLFVVRIVSIAVGSMAGARIVGESGHLRNRGWMAMVTQAGIALGLAREASIQFPSLGDAFATLIVAVIVLNEIFGPMLLKFVLGRVGEVDGGDGRTALVYGVDRNALRLTDRLEGDGWSVTLADSREEHLDEIAEDGDPDRAMTLITQGGAAAYLAELEELPDTIVAMSGDDRANLELCEAASEAGIERTVARVSQSELLDRFHDIGTLVIDPTRAAVALFEDAVRTPDATDLVLHNDPTRQTRQIAVRSAHLAGRAVRDLRLPAGVLVLAIRRNGTTMTPDGFTTVRRGDDLTVIGTPSLLREVDSRLSAPPASDQRRSRRLRAARRSRSG